ncbi:FAD:protein FMN transferase [Vibrio hippocampi]|nr:FAD:protein FMN transferase [Vibrio hippocampi]
MFTACSDSREQIHLSGPTMGTLYNIKYIETDRAPKPELIQEQVNKLLEQVNAQMSTYRQDSELSRFNRYYGTEPFPVSKQTAIVVKEAIRLNQVTKGALDVTVGPLVNLWGFGPEARPDKIPTQQELDKRLAQIGIEHLSATEDTLRKDLRSLYVDLSTIAKGWGVDVIAEYLNDAGIDDYMVEVGGEIRLKGLNREGVKWRIAIEKPDVDSRQVQEIIEPGDMAVATSGDYRNYFETDGVRYSHIIDPSTGKPISNKVVSVTVLDPSSMTADGLATGFMVLGEETSIEIANSMNIPMLMIVKTEQGFVEWTSEAFKPYLNK